MRFLGWVVYMMFVDLEGRSDDKIRIMEVVEELRSKRADKQVGMELFLY
jgi:hypothetical protein